MKRHFHLKIWKANPSATESSQCCTWERYHLDSGLCFHKLISPYQSRYSTDHDGTVVSPRTSNSQHSLSSFPIMKKETIRMNWHYKIKRKSSINQHFTRINSSIYSFLRTQQTIAILANYFFADTAIFCDLSKQLHLILLMDFFHFLTPTGR